MPTISEFPPSLDMTDCLRLFNYVFVPDGFAHAQASRASIAVANALHNRTLPNETNCQSFVHIAYQHCFNKLIPSWMLSYEIFTDQEIFRDVDWPNNEKLQIGDILFFERTPKEADIEFDPRDPKNYHMAVATGRFYEDGSPELIHANWVDGKVSIWPYWKFFQPIDHIPKSHEPKIRYRRFIGAKRMKAEEENFTSQFGSFCMYSRRDTDPFQPVPVNREWFPQQAVIYPNARI